VNRILAALALVLLVAGCVAPGGSGGELRWLEGGRPTYPEGAKARGVEGWVEVEYTVTAEGTVDDVRVVDASPAGVFDAAALAAVRTWRYRPLREDGRPVDTPGVRSRLDFRLGEAFPAY
jgi:protein TonB